MRQIIKNSLKNTEENILIVFLLAGYEIFSSFIKAGTGNYLSRTLMTAVLLLLFMGMLFLWMGTAAAAFKTRRGASWKVKDFLKGGLRGLPWALMWALFAAVVNSVLSYILLYLDIGESALLFWVVMGITAAAAYATILIPVAVASGSAPGEAIKTDKNILRENTLEWFLSGLYILLATAFLFIVNMVLYENLTAVENQWAEALFFLLIVVLRGFVIVVILSTVIELNFKAKKKFPAPRTVDTNI
ncbi:MAG: hypothetical protein U9R36_00035 [Elusimicrobiota bacterium]|nr:hypothetical protein [Elusimicrobiota bacterium]